MRTPSLILSLAVTFVFAAAPSAEAAKKGNKANRRGNAERMLGRFDRDSNGSLDAKESERVRKAFTVLKNLDTDKNGELSDSEIGAAKVAKVERRRKKKQ